MKKSLHHFYQNSIESDLLPDHPYGRLLSVSNTVQEKASPVREDIIQVVWLERLYDDSNMVLDDGRILSVISPGWWNRCAGPDFLNAQLLIDDKECTGDVEIHLEQGDWFRHGHHLDKKYNNVVLEVVLTDKPSEKPSTNQKGGSIPCLLLKRYLHSASVSMLGSDLEDLVKPVSDAALGQCAVFLETYGPSSIHRLFAMAGEWRLMQRTHRLIEHMHRVGSDQAVYEAFMTACGYSQYKESFFLLARHLPYERVRQLVRCDPVLLEAAMLKLSGLLPDKIHTDADNNHLRNLMELLGRELPGLGSLSLDWPRLKVRPVNYPERRIAGAVHFLARTSNTGLTRALMDVWQDYAKKGVALRTAFESLFVKPFGFWSTHCTWTGKPMKTPNAPIGPHRIRSLIGNVFVPFGSAIARDNEDRELEERVLDFFTALPGESSNHITRLMIKRFFGATPPSRTPFCLQQGMLQIYQDWCAENPSCHQCAIPDFIHSGIS